MALHLELLQLAVLVDLACHERQLEEEAEELEHVDDESPGLDGRKLEAGLTVSPDLAQHHRY